MESHTRGNSHNLDPELGKECFFSLTGGIFRSSFLVECMPLTALFKTFKRMVWHSWGKVLSFILFIYSPKYILKLKSVHKLTTTWCFFVSANKWDLKTKPFSPLHLVLDSQNWGLLNSRAMDQGRSLSGEFSANNDSREASDHKSRQSWPSCSKHTTHMCTLAHSELSEGEAELSSLLCSMPGTWPWPKHSRWPWTDD